MLIHESAFEFAPVAWPSRSLGHCLSGGLVKCYASSLGGTPIHSEHKPSLRGCVLDTVHLDAPSLCRLATLFAAAYFRRLQARDKHTASRSVFSLAAVTRTSQAASCVKMLQSAFTAIWPTFAVLDNLEVGNWSDAVKSQSTSAQLDPGFLTRTVCCRCIKCVLVCDCRTRRSWLKLLLEPVHALSPLPLTFCQTSFTCFMRCADYVKNALVSGSDTPRHACIQA